MTNNPFAEVTDADLKGIIAAFVMVVERLEAAGLNARSAKRSLKLAKQEKVARYTEEGVLSLFGLCSPYTGVSWSRYVDLPGDDF